MTDSGAHRGTRDSRRARVGLLLLATVAIAGALATAPSEAPTASLEPSAPPPDGFVGLQGWQHPDDADFARLKRANVHSYRFVLNWGVVERRRGRLRWAHYDRLFLRAARAEVRLLPVLLASPRWICNPSCRRHKPQWPPETRSERKRFYAFAREAARRYGPNGYFWRAKQLPEVTRAKWFQIWNEPNIPSYWNDDPDVREYARLVKTAGLSLKDGDRAARVLAAGLPQQMGRPRRGVIPIYTFLESMFDRSGVAAAVDGVAVHPYADANRGLFDRLDSARRALRHSPRGSTKRMFVTEFGWATGAGGAARWTTREGQARYLDEAYRNMLARRAEYRLDGAYWFSYRDTGPQPGAGDWWGIHTGLFDRRDRPKPAWSAYTNIAGGSP